MNVTIDDRGALRRIAIIGKLETRTSCESLIIALRHSPQHIRRIEVSFFDAMSLPCAVVEALASKLLGDSSKLSVQTYHPYLAHYLVRMGIPVSMIASRPIANRSPQTHIALIGATAEAIEKTAALIEALPPSNATLFIIQQPPTARHSNNAAQTTPEFRLDSLLKTHNDHYQILIPSQLSQIQPQTIYIAPSNYHIKIANGLLYLTRDRKIADARPSIDALFKSAALEFGAHLIGIILGAHAKTDGSEGVRALLRHGGIALIDADAGLPFETENTHPPHADALFFNGLSLPEISSFLGSALSCGSPKPQATLPTISIPATPTETTNNHDNTLSPILIRNFLTALYARYGYDFLGYQEKTLARRIQHVMNALSIPDFFEFQRRALTNPDVFQRFFLEMSIDVTRFFRHPQQLRLLREEILPYLDSFPHPRIWSAGCATGEEVFSLAIILEELGMLDKIRIFATDISPHALDQAYAGLFPTANLEQDRTHYLESGGKRIFDHYVANNNFFLKISERLRERVLFHQHSLVQDGVFNQFEFIICRNVLIYFHTEQQDKIMRHFANALHPEGFLVLGPQERLISNVGKSLFREYLPSSRVYRRKS
ncbi:chemotaxis protein methyltransferase CheR [Azospirillaceae bacterium]